MGRREATRSEETTPNSQETGANTPTTPFACEGGCMRAFRLVVCCFFLLLISISASALDFRVRVLDPSSSAVNGARVAVYAENSRQPLALGTSDAKGIANFTNLNGTTLRVEVLAPGFAPLSIAVKDSSEITAHLKLTSQSETVVVSAAPSPVEAGLSGAQGRYDYNLYGDNFHSAGQGANDNYDNATEGANLGLQLATNAFARLHVRHNNSHIGVPGETTFLGQQLLLPDSDAHAHQNNLLAALDLNIAAPEKWQHQLTIYNYNHQRHDIDSVMDPWRTSPSFGPIDFPYGDVADINRFGVRYSGEYWESRRARTNFGYEFEDENGFVGDTTLPPLNHGLRRNHAVYGEQFVEFGRLTAILGARFVHNESFGNRAIPRASLTYLVSRGHGVLTGTRLKGSYSEGIKEPRFEESFGIGGYNIIKNPALKAEEARNLEAGVEQKFGSRMAATATYFNTLFRNQINLNTDPVTFVSQYININKALAHGAELDVSARISPAFQLQGSYFYTSTQILRAPLSINPLTDAGAPLLRRPKHAGTVLLGYTRPRFGATLGGSFIGRRADSDFLGFGYTHAAGYARVDAGGWYRLCHHATLYANVENLLNRHYEEVLGYPALTANFRAGMRFHFGGE